jgi:hypothetical protein
MFATKMFMRPRVAIAAASSGFAFVGLSTASTRGGNWPAFVAGDASSIVMEGEAVKAVGGVFNYQSSEVAPSMIRNGKLVLHPHLKSPHPNIYSPYCMFMSFVAYLLQRSTHGN